MSVDLGDGKEQTETPYGSAFVLWETGCYSSYSIDLLQKGWSFTFPGCLLWKLADVPSLVVIKSKIPTIWRWVVVVVMVIFA